MSENTSEDGVLEASPTPRLSWIWLVPVIVVVIAATTVYQAYVERGVTVEIRFAQGKGIEAGKTEVRFKDVVVGRVESLRLTKDFEGVIASVLLDRDVAPYLGEQTDFWVVTAEISGTSFRGLSTLLSGAYIEVDWPGVATKPVRKFVGELQAPMTPPSVGGRHFLLTSPTAGSVTVGSPITFRGVTVGQIERRALSENYEEIEYEVFVNAPFDNLVTKTTRFFDVSGVSVSISSEGFELKVASLQTLATGGISFYTPAGDQIPEPAAAAKVFPLFESLAAAEESFFDTDGAQHFYFTAVFEDGVEGLEPGAAVMWQGVRIGTVRDIRLDLQLASEPARLGVVLDLQPARIGLESEDLEQALEEVAALVEAGMRIEIANSNLFTGSKRLNLVLRPDSDAATLQLSALPFPRIPTVKSSMGDVTENLSDIAAGLAAVPYEDLAAAASSLLLNASALLGSPETQALPEYLANSLGSIDGLAQELRQVATRGEDALVGIAPDSALYAEMTATVRELRKASRAVSTLATMLEEKPNALLIGRD